MLPTRSMTVSAVTPGRILPARELLGDMLVIVGKPADALAEYEKSQLREPNRYRGLYGAGLAAAQAGETDKARLHLGKLMEMAGPRVRATELKVVREYVASN